MRIISDFNEIRTLKLDFRDITGLYQYWKNHARFSYLTVPRPYSGLMMVLCPGVRFIFADGTVLEGKEGDIIYIPHGFRYFAEFENPKPEASPASLLLNFLSFTPDGEEIFLSDIPFILTHDLTMKSFFSEVINEVFTGNQLLLTGNFCILLEHLIENSVLVPNGKEAREFDMILTYIHKTLGKSQSIEQLARHFSMSESTLRRRFQDRMGISPTMYIINKKIEYAKKMLQISETTLETVCEELGFYDSAHFIRTFKQHTGMTPGEYRKNYKL